MSGPDGPDLQRLADALKDGVRYEPPPPPDAGGVAGLYRRSVYAPVIARRRSRVWAFRNPEPWLTTQSLLELAGGQGWRRSRLRYEGLPGAHDYSASHAAIARGEFTRPFLFAAGYSRTGTTSLQNLLIAAAPAHLPPGRWNDAGHPLRLWWYPKHNPAVAERVGVLDPVVCRVLVTVRQVVPSLASFAIYTGIWEPADLSEGWVHEQADQWERMTRTARLPAGMAVPFPWIRDATPAALADRLGDALRLLPADGAYREGTWDALHRDGISADVVDHPQSGNLPHARRAQRLPGIEEAVTRALGSRLGELDALYWDVVAGSPLAARPQ